MMSKASESMATQHRESGNLLVALQEAQTRFGYLPPEFMVELADSLGVPVNDVYGVASFYSFLSTIQSDLFFILNRMNWLVSFIVYFVFHLIILAYFFKRLGIFFLIVSAAVSIYLIPLPIGVPAPTKT